MRGAVTTRQFDEMLDALGHVQRRQLLRELLTHNPLDAEQPHGEDEPATEAVERLAEMEHVHLPKLEEYGFITRHRDANEIVTGPNFDEIRPLLELLVEHEDELPDDWL